MSVHSSLSWSQICFLSVNVQQGIFENQAGGITIFLCVGPNTLTSTLIKCQWCPHPPTSLSCQQFICPHEFSKHCWFRWSTALALIYMGAPLPNQWELVFCWFWRKENWSWQGWWKLSQNGSSKARDFDAGGGERPRGFAGLRMEAPSPQNWVQRQNVEVSGMPEFPFFI